MSRPIQHHANHPTVVKQQYDTHNVWTFEHEWNTKLFGCKPFGRCCFSCICPCCMGCKLAKYTGETTIIGCFPCSFSYLRTKLRTARRIKGSCCGDLCAANCCMGCSATQMANELESQGLWDAPKAKKGKAVHNERGNQYHDNY